MDGEGEVLPDLKPPKRGGKRGKADPKDLIARGPVSPEEYEARRNRLKQLIKLGKDRGYLTYGEINARRPGRRRSDRRHHQHLQRHGDRGL